MQYGALVISLDFELLWGVRDKRTIADYGANILGVRQVVPALLDLFAERNIACTWATVGLLFFATNKDAAAPRFRRASRATPTREFPPTITLTRSGQTRSAIRTTTDCL